MTERLTWIARGDPRMKTGRAFELQLDGVDTGFVVRHCGHPTANYPWYIETDELLAPSCSNFHGTFRLLTQAKAMAVDLYTGEKVHAGDLYVDGDADDIARRRRHAAEDLERRTKRTPDRASSRGLGPHGNTRISSNPRAPAHGSTPSSSSARRRR